MARLTRCGSLEDLTVSQFGVLESLYHLGPMCQSTLGAKLLRSGGNITMVIDNLEKRGLVHRERDPDDRRMTVINLTKAGTELIERIFPNHLAEIVREMNALTPQEQEQLGALCKKLGTSGQET